MLKEKERVEEHVPGRQKGKKSTQKTFIWEIVGGEREEYHGK